MVDMSDIMSQYKAVLESGQELTEEEVNDIITGLSAIEEWLFEVESQVFG